MAFNVPVSVRQERQTSSLDVQTQPKAKPASKVFRALVTHVKRHVGVGIICSVAYFDPGNWSVDLQAGSQFGYKLLFAVLISGLGAVILQVLACKLGCVTGLNLAQHCRLLMHDHPRYPKLVRYACLYPLYIISELAIISTDLAELLGSAIGLVLLFPTLPLPAAVLLTAADVVFILGLGDSNKGRPVRIFELLVITLVLIVFISFTILIVDVGPYWPEVFKGYLPSHALVDPEGLYTAIGILGATVMPHALFLGSYLSTQDRVSPYIKPMPPSLPEPTSQRGFVTIKKTIRRLFSVSKTQNDGEVDLTTPYGVRHNNTMAFVKAHLSHGKWDIILSLLGFAVLINSAILVIAGAVFFFGPGKAANNQAAGLFDAHDLIRQYIGKAAAFIFALALICSGQSASITATLAGQVVSEGFIQWSISPFLRRLCTRLLGLIPSMIVATAIGRAGIDTLLVISQVVLSIVLPFVMFPLIWLTSSPTVMRVRKIRVPANGEISVGSKATDERIEEVSSEDSSDINIDGFKKKREGSELREDSSEEGGITEEKVKRMNFLGIRKNTGANDGEYVDYSNSRPLMVLCYAIWLVVLVANAYLIVTLAIG